MIRPVQQLPSDSTPADLSAYYRDPPDGVRVNMVSTLDGAASFGGVVGPLSDPTDQNLLLTLRGYADVVLVGAGTARAERYGPVKLSTAQVAERRGRWGAESAPAIAVVTHTGRLPASLFADAGAPPIVVTTDAVLGAAPQLAARADVVLAGDASVDLPAALTALRARGLRRILCEGGPTLLDELVAHDLVDEMCLTLSPTLAATPATSRPGAPALAAPVRMALGHAMTVDDYVYLRYTRERGPRP